MAPRDRDYTGYALRVALAALVVAVLIVLGTVAAVAAATGRPALDIITPAPMPAPCRNGGPPPCPN